MEVEQDFTYIKAVWGSAMIITTGIALVLELPAIHQPLLAGMSKQPVHSDWGRIFEVITLIIGTLMFAMVLAVIHNAVRSIILTFSILIDRRDCSVENSIDGWQLVLRPKDRYGLKCIASINRNGQLQKNATVLIQVHEELVCV